RKRDRAAHRHRRRLFVADAIRNVTQHLRRHGHELCVRARAVNADQNPIRACIVASGLACGADAARDERHAHDALARLETAAALTRLDHLAGKVGAEDVRKGQARERVASGACADVEQATNANDVHAHEHLAGLCHRRGHVLYLQDVSRAELVNDRSLHSLTTGLRSRPKSPTSISTTSPGRRNSPRGSPTPPGSRVRISLAAAMSAATLSIMSDVFACCLSAPFTHRRSSNRWGSSTRNAGRTPGPSGVERSAPLEASQSHSNGTPIGCCTRCGPRSETSLIAE